MDVTAAAAEMFVFGPFRLVPSEHLLFAHDRPLRVGGRALDILQALVERAGDVVSHQELMARVWGDTAVEDGNLRVHITALRKTLSDGKPGARYIANVPGRGYSFVAPVARTRGPEPLAPSGYRLPAVVTQLIGRESQRAALVEQLAARRLVTLVGPAGVGKTALAVAAAHQLAPDGVRYIDLGEVEGDVAAAAAIAGAAGLAVLVVLDNCEHVVDAVAAFAERALRSAPQIRILATCREPLRLDGEWVTRLAPLELPPADGPITAAEALGFAAVALFAARARASVEGFELGDGDAPIVRDICRHLDGLPLAIELAAARVEALGLRGLRDQLAASAGLALPGRRTANPRQRTLRALLDASHATLSVEAQVLLRRLSVFRGPFTLDSAATVVAGDGLGAAAVADGVIDLAAKSLVVADVRSDVVSYRLLAVTRAYAAEQLVAAGERGELARRHAAHQAELFAQAPGSGRGPLVEGREGDRVRLADVRDALESSFADGGDREVGVALTLSSMPLWFESSLLDEYRGHVERALGHVQRAGGAPSPTRELQLLLAHSQLVIHTVGPIDEAKAAATRALAIAEELGILLLRLQALGALWVVCFARAEYTETEALAQRFAAACGSVTSLSVRLVRDMLLAGSHAHWGRYAEARRLLEPMLTLPVARRAGLAGVADVDGEVAVLSALARTLWIQGYPARALQLARDCVIRAQASGSAASLCFALGHSALPVAIWSGASGTAEDWLALLVREASERRLGGWLAWARAYERAIGRGSLGFGAAAVEPTHAIMIGTIDPWQVDLETFARADAGGLAWCAPEILRARALQIVEPSASAVLLDRAIDLAAGQGALSWQLRATTSLATLRRDQGRAGDARAILEPVYQRFTEGFDTRDLVAARTVLDELRSVS